MEQKYSEQTYAVFGDVGGHYKPFMNALQSLGFDKKTFRIPANLTIIQNGDLVHKGKSSNQLVPLVDNIMRANNSDPEAGNWIQIFGNHEAQYFVGAPRFWNMECDVHSIVMMNSWWRNKDARLHYVIEQNDGKPFIVSHAGVSHRLFYHAESHWNRVDTGEPVDFAKNLATRTVADFSAWVDSLQPEHMDRAAVAGAMLYGKISPHAGLIWAESVSEVYATWRGEQAPFHQIHGHVTPYNWSLSKFYPNVHEVFRRELVLDKRKRHSTWTNDDGTMFIGIDPGFSKSADRDTITPLILTADGIVG